MALRNPPFCEDKILPDGKMIAIHSMSLISTIGSIGVWGGGQGGHVPPQFDQKH